MGLRLSAIVLLACASLAEGAGGSAFFKTSGTNILDQSGSNYFIRGQALNGVLIPEAYQLRLNSVHWRHLGSASAVEKNILNLLGTNAARAQTFWDTYRSNYVTMADLAMLKAEGFNTVRLPFNYRLVQPYATTGVWNDAGFQILSNIVAWCKSNDLAVILDMHCAPGGQSGDAPSDPEHTYWAWDTNVANWIEHGVGCLWETNADYTAATGRTPAWNRQRMADIWREIAKRFKNEKQILGYELINEPFLPAGVHWPVLRELLTNVTAAVRAEDTNHIIFVEGNYFAGTFEGLFPTWDSNLVYVFHRYWATANTASISAFLGARASNNVPIVMGETGENSNPWFYQFKNVLESNNVGWCWWGWKKVDSIAGAYAAQITPDYQYVIDNFRDSHVDSNRIFKGLMELATNIQTSLCREEPGYFPSLRDPQFDVFRKPYKFLTAPGYVEASAYDVGDHGTAYNDTRYKQEDGAGGAAWNGGWRYRNDGVDIFSTTSGLGNGYKIGDIAAGEWIRYTLVNTSAVSCEAVVRVASATNTGRIRLKLNGANLTANLTVPNTGSYEAWTNLSGGNVTIPAGTNRLEVSISAGGYDLAGIFFQPTNRVVMNLGYHNNIATNALVEQVPGTNGAGAFLQVNYSATTTTFYAMAPSPTVAARFDETGQVAIKVTYWHPTSNLWIDLFTPMSNVAQVVLTSTNPFHGLPASGAVTASLYRLDWAQPRGAGGAPLTNEIVVYYAPYFSSYSSTGETARVYLANRAALFTNSYPAKPQLFDTNFFDSDYAYTNLHPAPLPSASAPTCSPNGGTYTSAVNVTISSATAGATNYYTTDGSSPTTNSPSATNNAIVTLSQPYANSIRSFARADGYQDSAISTSAAFSVVAMPVAASPACSPNGGTYTSAVSVTISSATAGATNYYTTDGSAPTTNSPSATNNAIVTLSQPYANSIRSFARAGGYQDSAISTSAAFSVVAMPVAGAPMYAPDGGTHTGAVYVTLSSTTTSATIYYTTDGSAPATNSATVTNGGAITLSQPYANRVRSFARASGCQDSAVSTSAVFSVVAMPVAATPTFNPDGGTYTGSVAVTLSSATAGATIYYTTDGTGPSTNSASVTNHASIMLSPLYAGSVRAFVRAAGHQDSATTTSAAFSVVAPADADEDGMIDAWEQQQFGNLDQGGTNDMDGDGVSNFDEFIADTQPTNSASFLWQAISDVSANTTTLAITPSSTGRVYSAWAHTNLMSFSSWWDCGVSSAGNGATLYLTVTNSSDSAHYGVRARLP